MEMMNRKIVEANIALQDKNNLLEEDKRILQSRIDKAIEYIEGQNKFISGCDVYRITNWEYVLNILKGE